MENKPCEHLAGFTMSLGKMTCIECMNELPPYAPMPPLRWCQHCGDDIGGQGRRICAMCEADVAEREEHRGNER